ncbi:hypothetical protein DFH09DRAFT_1084906 [Mycena vulgaris]|nr:hypothetical protein DFH09DRAFT_1084906 [Mycena vulgaris]
MHFTFPLIIIGFATRVLAQTNGFTFFAGVVDPDTQALGLEARVNGVDQWFASNEAEWLAIELGPILQSKAGWEQIAGGDETAIIFEYNQTAPSPILGAEFTNTTWTCPSLTSTPLPDAAFRDTMWSSVITAQQDDATNYVPVPFTDRTIVAGTSACTDLVSLTVVDANGNVANVQASDTVSWSIPVDAIFPLQFTITTVNHGNATYVLSDALGITFVTGPNASHMFNPDDQDNGGEAVERSNIPGTGNFVGGHWRMLMDIGEPSGGKRESLPSRDASHQNSARQQG